MLPTSLGALANSIRQARPSVAAVHADVPARRGFWSRLLAAGGPLDPLAPQPDPADAIARALESPIAGENRTDTIQVGEAGADALTLTQLRLMAQADLVLHEPGIPAEVLALVRRDAARRMGTDIPEGQGGRIVLILSLIHILPRRGRFPAPDRGRADRLACGRRRAVPLRAGWSFRPLPDGRALARLAGPRLPP